MRPVFTQKNIHRFLTTLLALGILLTSVVAQADNALVVSNVQANQRLNSFIVDITYDLFDADGYGAFISVYFSPDGGQTWPVRCVDVTGAANNFFLPGTGLSVAWNAETDYPDLISSSCTVRVVAVDHSPWPYFESIWRSDLDGQNEFLLPYPGYQDTVGFGQPFRLRWQGIAPIASDMDPLMVADLDSVFPHDDGLQGYKYQILGQDCIPSLEDCWQPRRFNEATGDSFSYFAEVTHLDFFNDGSGPGPFHALLSSGVLSLQLNTQDIAGLDVPEYLKALQVVVNFDPETIMLDGETDWAHPEDPEVYPYYILLNDPLQIHHPFQSGDRIPDRTYVVAKALGRDDARDLPVSAGYGVGISGYVRGVRQNMGGGQFSFQSEASALSHPPTWGPNAGGWSADTLGFLTGPNTEFSFSMQAVDEHGRKDGSPETITFDVGYPPCLQCVEVLAKSSLPSAYPESPVCLEDTSPATIAAHPCFNDTTVLRVSQSGGGDDYLEFVQPAFMLVNKNSGFTQVVLSPGQGGDDNFEIDVNLYRMAILLHGQDDPRESWDEMVRRLMGVRYQVDYECDPYNQIQDGGGNDDIRTPTWGINSGETGIEIDPVSGLWRLFVDVAVPRNLMILGPDAYRDVALRFLVGIEDPELRERVFHDTTKQFGLGNIRTVALDQTQCGLLPVRPARYNFFRYVRPSVATLPPGRTWRDCDLKSGNIVPDIMLDLDLSQGAMFSLEGEPVAKYFRIIIETDTGDFECQFPTGY